MMCAYIDHFAVKQIMNVCKIIYQLLNGGLQKYFLTLNPSKCKYMLISRKRSPTLPDIPLLLHELPLCQVDTFKYLGILLSEDLSWSPHINAICSEAQQVLGLLYRRFYHFSNTDTLVQLCTSWYVPVLNMLALYGNPA